jgi:hypothetical protein
MQHTYSNPVPTLLYLSPLHPEAGAGPSTGGAGWCPGNAPPFACRCVLPGQQRRAANASSEKPGAL